MPEKTTGLIVGPYGDPLKVQAVKLDAEDARILRLYKKFLQKYGLKETTYCDGCWEHNLEHGCEAYVTNEKIVIRCRCSLRVFDGPTY